MKTSVRAGICEFGTLPMGPQQNSGIATGYWYLAKGLQQNSLPNQEYEKERSDLLALKLF